MSNTVNNPIDYDSIKVGDVIVYNYFGQSHDGVVSAKRECATNQGVYYIFAEHVITVDARGNGVSNNNYASAIVRCEDSDETRAALELIQTVVDNNTYKSIEATVRCPVGSSTLSDEDIRRARRELGVEKQYYDTCELCGYTLNADGSCSNE